MVAKRQRHSINIGQTPHTSFAAVLCDTELAYSLGRSPSPHSQTLAYSTVLTCHSRASFGFVSVVIRWDCICNRWRSGLNLTRTVRTWRRCRPVHASATQTQRRSWKRRRKDMRHTRKSLNDCAAMSASRCSFSMKIGWVCDVCCELKGSWQWQQKVYKYVCITTNQPDTKSNPNPNPYPATKVTTESGTKPYY